MDCFKFFFYHNFLKRYEMEIEWFLSHIESFIGWINAHFITNHYWHNNHVFFKHHSLFHLLFFKPPSSTFTARLASNLKCATFLSFDISNAFFVPFLVETIHYLQTMTLFLFTFSTLSHLSKNQGGTLLQKCKKLSLWQRGCVSCYGCQEIQEKGRVKNSTAEITLLLNSRDLSFIQPHNHQVCGRLNVLGLETFTLTFKGSGIALMPHCHKFAIKKRKVTKQWELLFPQSSCGKDLSCTVNPVWRWS